jgi:hypothetical protein
MDEFRGGVAHVGDSVQELYRHPFRCDRVLERPRLVPPSPKPLRPAYEYIHGDIRSFVDVAPNAEDCLHGICRAITHDDENIHIAIRSGIATSL